MYYLVKKKFDSIKILSSCEDLSHKELILFREINKEGISYINNKEEVKETGLYCCREGINTYSVYSAEIFGDGYILSGSRIFKKLYYYEIVFYNETESHLKKSYLEELKRIHNL